MTPFILKISFLSMSSIAAYLIARVSVKYYRTRVIPRLLLNEKRIAKSADLGGMNFSGRFRKILALACPVTLLILQVIRKRRMVKIDSQVPDLLNFLCSALKAGLSLPQAIEMASIELAEPIAHELSRVASGLKLGVAVNEALALFAKRVPTDDIGLFVQSVEILRRAGGNLIETFASLTKTIEGRRKVADRIRVLTAEGIYQGMALLAMPWLLGIALYAMAPEYIEPLVGTKLGLVFIAAGVLLEVLGALWLKKIVVIKV